MKSLRLFILVLLLGWVLGLMTQTHTQVDLESPCVVQDYDITLSGKHIVTLSRCGSVLQYEIPFSDYKSHTVGSTVSIKPEWDPYGCFIFG